MRNNVNLGLVNINVYTKFGYTVLKALGRNEIIKNGMMDGMIDERIDGQFKSSMATLLVKFDQVFEEEMLFE